MKKYIFFVILSYFYIIKNIINIATCNNNTFELKVCHDHVPIKTDAISSVSKIVDVMLGTLLHLQCHFCIEDDNFIAKVWYFKKRGDDANMHEIITRMKNNVETCKIYTTPPQTLNIKEFRVNDSGIYICKHREQDMVFTYVLDAVFDDKVLPKNGTVDQWRAYKRMKIDSINRKFEISQEKPFVIMRNDFQFSFRLILTWENWSEWELWGRQKSVRRRLGKCRLHPVIYNNTKAIGTSNTIFSNITDYYTIDHYDVSCRSMKLYDFFPELSNIVRFMPEFEILEYQNRPGKNKEKNDFIYNILKQIPENGYITLVCSETRSGFNAEWYKNEGLLNLSYSNNVAIESEPHLIIDAYNSLHIQHASKKEEGIYTCIVNGKKKYKYDVRIISKSKLLNQEFIRYSIYLGFVLSLTITCYCTGICLAWHRRASFKDPLKMTAMKNCNAKLCEQECLLK